MIKINEKKERVKMKLKKTVAYLMTAAVIAGCLTGCGKDGKNASNENLTTITMWSNNSHSKDVMEKRVKEFNEGEGKKLGIYFEYEVKEGSSFSNSMDVALQTGQAPDLLAIGNLQQNVEKGYVAPLDELPGGKEMIQKYEGKFMEGAHTYNGKTYSLPTEVTTRGLLYNKDMFKKAGIVDEDGNAKPPKNFKELREYAKKLTNESKNQYGIIFPMKWGGWVGSDINDFMLQSAGNYGFDPTTGKYDYSAVIPVIETYQNIIKDGSAYPGMQGIDNDQARAYFAQGLIGMKFGYSFDVGVLNDQFPAECDWGVAPLPAIDGDEPQYKQFLSYGMSTMINAKSVKEKDPEKIMAVFKWFYSDESVIENYKNCISIPVEWDLVKDIDTKNLKKGWAEFTKMTEISNKRNLMPNYDMSGKLTWAERITDQVFAGKISAQKMVEQYNKDITEATDKYYAAHTDEDFNKYLDKSWDIKR